MTYHWTSGQIHLVMRTLLTLPQEHLLTVLQWTSEVKQNDAYENSPPPSQPRPTARNTKNNPLDQKQPENRGLTPKYDDQKKIAKTEDSILKLERHLNSQTCPKSQQYSAKANIAPNSTFQKEIKDIKQTVEEALVNALTRFHK